MEPSFQLVATHKDMKKEREYCQWWVKKYNIVVNKGIQDAHTAFHWAIEKI